MFLLDTNIVSALRVARMQRGDPLLASWFESVRADDISISAITIEHLQIGIQRVEQEDIHQGAVLRKWMSGYLVKHFRDRVISVDIAVASRSAFLHAQRTWAVPDALIAASAFVHRLTVVTRYPSNYADARIKVVSPWMVS